MMIWPATNGLNVTCESRVASGARSLPLSTMMAALLSLALPITAAMAQQAPAPASPATGAPVSGPPVAAAADARAQKPPAPPPLAGILVVDDGFSGIDPLAGAQEAVKRYAQGDRRVDLVATTAAKAGEAIRSLAPTHPVIVVVASNAGPILEQTARDLPDNRFTLVGASANGANIRSVLFRDGETEWLSAWLAGRLSGEGHVGFVGGPARGERRAALCAAAQGLTAANRNALLFPDLESTDVEPPLEARRGAQLARGQIDRGASIIITPLGAAGAGAMESVRDMGALGVVRNNSALALYPGNVAGVQKRRYDTVILNALETFASNAWTAGPASIGLKEAAVELRLNDSVAPPIPQNVRTALQDNVTAIINGSLVISDMTPDGRCPIPRRR